MGLLEKNELSNIKQNTKPGVVPASGVMTVAKTRYPNGLFGATKQEAQAPAPAEADIRVPIGTQKQQLSASNSNRTHKLYDEAYLGGYGVRSDADLGDIPVALTQMQGAEPGRYQSVISLAQQLNDGSKVVKAVLAFESTRAAETKQNMKQAAADKRAELSGTTTAGTPLLNEVKQLFSIIDQCRNPNALRSKEEPTWLPGREAQGQQALLNLQVLWRKAYMTKNPQDELANLYITREVLENTPRWLNPEQIPVFNQFLHDYPEVGDRVGMHTKISLMENNLAANADANFKKW